MMKYILALWVSFLVGIRALAVPESTDASLTAREGPELPPELEGLRVVKYEGPHYELPAEEREKLRHARETGGEWERPQDMPVIHVEDGTILDMGGNSTLAKRAGWRWIAAYGGYNCDSGTAMTGVLNFGCGTGCVVLSSKAYSGLVQQQWHGNPYPTMDVWDNNQCSGHYMQHFGVVDTRSCTNANCCGYKSFIGWWNC